MATPEQQHLEVDDLQNGHDKGLKKRLSSVGTRLLQQAYTTPPLLSVDTDLANSHSGTFRGKPESEVANNGATPLKTPKTPVRKDSLRYVWTPRQDQQLIQAVLNTGQDWATIGDAVPGHSAEECQHRWLQKLQGVTYKLKSRVSSSSHNPIKSYVSQDVKMNSAGGIVLIIDCLLNSYKSKLGLKATSFYVKLKVNGMAFKTKAVKRGKLQSNDVEDIVFKEVVKLPLGVTTETEIKFKVYIKHRVVKDVEVGEALIKLGTLIERQSRDLTVCSGDHLLMHNSQPIQLRVHVVSSTIPNNFAKPKESMGKILNSPHPPVFPKHVMMMTRGTRGDVQPFIALARGLAEQLGWMVTICTELRYRDYIKRYSKVNKGCIRFRPCGGDTTKRMDTDLVRWATSLESSRLQTVMLAYSEREFFASEEALYYWTKAMDPDLIIFGFTLTSIAMIISEALNKPILGFILQPTVMPSEQYPPIVPLRYNSYLKWSKKENRLDPHGTVSTIKALAENNTLSSPLNAMRKRHGLRKQKGWSASTGPAMSETWSEIKKRDLPIVVPINPLAFGGKPNDWHSNAVLTNYIFLQGTAVPQLEEKYHIFHNACVKAGRKIVILAFSSMPVLKKDIFNIAVAMVNECEQQVSVIALIGNHENDNSVEPALQQEVDLLSERGRLLVDVGAPFGRLFPLAHAVVVHGGLGTTAEALKCGVPVIVTGVLLMDQRFWGCRCFELGVGPYPVHISKFRKQCVDLIDKALDKNSSWAKRAKEVGSQLSLSLSADPSGVDVNVAVIHRLSSIARPYVYLD